jgi:hypothetical protein
LYVELFSSNSTHPQCALTSNPSSLFLQAGTKITKLDKIRFNLAGKLTTTPSVRSLPVAHVAGQYFYADPDTASVMIEHPHPAWLVPADVPEESEEMASMVLKMEEVKMTSQWGKQMAAARMVLVGGKLKKRYSLACTRSHHNEDLLRGT